ncbi:hypothetical protein BTHERMOSOX_1033 [Bathymodiolus thermophilus thioautotrophic gill symbiont]|uniref:hypothetical protein n=1 Tax=Bathymodiolus thermophilus thioautotrophic gill symbiont TaxID=2360 RepID=UPI0010B5E3E8|nr:hypothetical protein [Bathymodiolus thermophilus thioautotrophic gill symbiont]SHA29596.1 hypothetical protein BTHERMOSOX_1033 [Bathymodiolus thermophilus thioautotrophic gill symbiont]
MQPYINNFKMSQVGDTLNMTVTFDRKVNKLNPSDADVYSLLHIGNEQVLGTLDSDSHKNEVTIYFNVSDKDGKYDVSKKNLTTMLEHKFVGEADGVPFVGNWSAKAVQQFVEVFAKNPEVVHLDKDKHEQLDLPGVVETTGTNDRVGSDEVTHKIINFYGELYKEGFVAFKVQFDNALNAANNQVFKNIISVNGDFVNATFSVSKGSDIAYLVYNFDGEHAGNVSLNLKGLNSALQWITMGKDAGTKFTGTWTENAQVQFDKLSDGVITIPANVNIIDTIEDTTNKTDESGYKITNFYGALYDEGLVRFKVQFDDDLKPVDDRVFENIIAVNGNFVDAVFNIPKNSSVAYLVYNFDGKQTGDISLDFKGLNSALQWATMGEDAGTEFTGVWTENAKIQFDELSENAISIPNNTTDDTVYKIINFYGTLHDEGFVAFKVQFDNDLKPVDDQVFENIVAVNGNFVDAVFNIPKNSSVAYLVYNFDGKQTGDISLDFKGLNSALQWATMGEDAGTEFTGVWTENAKIQFDELSENAITIPDNKETDEITHKIINFYGELHDEGFDEDFVTFKVQFDNDLKPVGDQVFENIVAVNGNFVDVVFNIPKNSSVAYLIYNLDGEHTGDVSLNFKGLNSALQWATMGEDANIDFTEVWTENAQAQFNKLSDGAITIPAANIDTMDDIEDKTDESEYKIINFYGELYDEGFITFKVQFNNTLNAVDGQVFKDIISVNGDSVDAVFNVSKGSDIAYLAYNFDGKHTGGVSLNLEGLNSALQWITMGEEDTNANFTGVWTKNAQTQFNELSNDAITIPAGEGSVEYGADKDSGSKINVNDVLPEKGVFGGDFIAPETPPDCNSAPGENVLALEFPPISSVELL